MRNFMTSRIGCIFLAAIIGGLAIAATSGAEARDWDHWGYRGHWHHYWVPPGHVRYWEPGPAYYWAPPIVAYAPPAYYGPPSLNFDVTVPLR